MTAALITTAAKVGPDRKARAAEAPRSAVGGRKTPRWTQTAAIAAIARSFA